MAEFKALIRLRLGDNIERSLRQPLQDLSTTQYKLGAKNHEAPKITDCVTAVRYLVHSIVDSEVIPLLYIGDMPKVLLRQQKGKVTIVPLEQYSIGDLVFFYGKSRFQMDMIRHVGMIINNEGDFFHSMRGKNSAGGARIWNIGDEKIQKLISTNKQLIESTDPRNFIKNLSLN